MLSLANVCTDTLPNSTFCLRDITLSTAANNNLAIIGETGSGKSTLLKCIAGLVQHSSGTISFNDVVRKGPYFQLIAGYADIAYLSQHYELRHNYRMEELLSYANQLSNKDFNHIIELCDIQHLLKRNSQQLSGGEKQRIAIARLLITKPKLIILDEPFSNLDAMHQASMHQLIDNFCAEYKVMRIMASHSAAEVMGFASHIIALQDGRIKQYGTADEVFYNPVNDYVAGLLGVFFKHEGQYVRAIQVHVHDNGIYSGTVSNIQHCGEYFLYSILFQQQTIYASCNVKYPMGTIVRFDIAKN